MYFGKILEYLYTTAKKTYGFYNGRLDKKHFYKTNVQLPYAPVWTLEDMIAQAAKKNIKIKYTTVYKDIKIQEQDFVKINRKKPTAVSKASSSEVAKNGRLYNKVKWYPTTITKYNPLPGFNIFGTGLCIKLKNNNDRIINFIKANGADYGWSWCSNIPTTDPDFQNILVYSAGKNKPNKYRDRTSEYPILGFRPNRDNVNLLGYNPATHKSVWVPVMKSVIVPSGPNSTELVRVDTGAGRYKIVEHPKPTIKATTTTRIYVDAKNNDSPAKIAATGVTFPSSRFFGSTKKNNKGIKVLVLNNTERSGYAAAVSNILKNIGFIGSRAISCVVSDFNIAYGGTTVETTRIGELHRGIWGSAGIRRTLLAKTDHSYYSSNILSEAKVVDAINTKEFMEYVTIPEFTQFQNPFVFPTLRNWKEHVTAVFVRKDISSQIGDNFVDIIKYIERDSSLYVIPASQTSVLIKSNIDIQKVEVSNISNPKLYDYMTNGKSIVFDLQFANYCITRGYYKLINNKKLTKQIYGTVEIDPTGAKAQLDNYGRRIFHPGTANHLFNFLEFTKIKPWPKGYPTLDGSPTSNWALAERTPVAGDHFDSFLTSAGKKEYRSLSKIFVALKLKYQVIEPADIIVNLDTNWNNVTTNQTILNKLKFNQTIVKTVQSSNTVVVKPTLSTLPPLPATKATATTIRRVKSRTIRKATSSTTSATTSTTMPSKATTTTTTAPKSTTTSLAPKSSTTLVPPKYVRPDSIDFISDQAVSALKVSEEKKYKITNDIVPVIVGDSIALGIAQRFEVKYPNTNTRATGQKDRILAYPPSTLGQRDLQNRIINRLWDGENQALGRNMVQVKEAFKGAVAYMKEESFSKNAVYVISTGAANIIDKPALRNTIEVTLGEMLQFTKTPGAFERIGIIYFIGISNQQNQKSIDENIYDFNTALSSLCDSSNGKYVFLGGFNAPGDSVHPPDYNKIVDDLIERILKFIPPEAIPIPSTTTLPPKALPINPSTTTTTTVPPEGYLPYIGILPGYAPWATTTITTTVPVVTKKYPRRKPKDRQRVGPVITPIQTTTTTVAPDGTSTTTTVTRPTTTTTTTTPSTTTTVAPDGTSTTTTVAPNGTTTTTVVVPPTTTPPTTTPPTTTPPTTTPPTTVPVITVPPTTVPPTTVPSPGGGRVSPPVTILEPKLESYSVISVTPENDNQRVNVDVRVELEFDVPIIKGSGYIFFYKKNTSKALAKIYVYSSEVTFVNRNTIRITPRNILTYDTGVSVIINPNVFRSTLGKSWSGNVGKWNDITFTTIKNPNLPQQPDPVESDDPLGDPPKVTVPVPGDRNIDVSIRTNDGLWQKDDQSVGMNFKALKQNVSIVETNPNTSWVLQFNVLSDYGAVKNIGRIGLERDAPKCAGGTDASAVCFFTMYGAMKTLPDATFKKNRKAPCENKILDRGPGLSLRNKLIWRQGDSFEFRVSFSLTQIQEYNVTHKCLSTQRPSTVNISDTIYETDTDKIYMWDGLVWFEIAASTLNISQGRVFENPNTFVVNGNWWNASVWNKTVKRTYPLGNIFVPLDYSIIDAERNYVKYSGPESQKRTKSERQSFARFIAPVGFAADGVRGVYKSR